MSEIHPLDLYKEMVADKILQAGYVYNEGYDKLQVINSKINSTKTKFRNEKIKSKRSLD